MTDASIGKGDWILCIKKDPTRDILVVGNTYYVEDLNPPPSPILRFTGSTVRVGVAMCINCKEIEEVLLNLAGLPLTSQGVRSAWCPKIFQPLKRGPGDLTEAQKSITNPCTEVRSKPKEPVHG